MKEGWKYATTGSGVQFVMMVSDLLRVELFVDNLGLKVGKC